MDLLLTGASGFLGAALAHRWVEAGHRVTLLLRSMSSVDRLAGVLDRVRIRRSDSEAQAAELAREGAYDAIVHTACAYGRQGESLLRVFDANLGLGVALLDGAMSSSRPTVFINTGTVLAPNVSPYALSKTQFSAWGRHVVTDSSSGLRFLNIQLQHMYGPGDSATKFTTHVIRGCWQNLERLALTPGEQHRDFIYIDDVVAAYDVILTQHERFASYEDVDVGSGIAPTVRSFVETVHRVTESTTRLDFGAVPYRANEAMHCQADISRLKDMGWQPKYSLEDGIRRTLQLDHPP